MDFKPHIFRDGFALLIGVGHYSDQRLSLPGTINDAIELEKVFINPDLCGYPSTQVDVLVNQSPEEQSTSKHRILKGLRWLKDHTSEKSTVIIYFSGHAISIPVKNDKVTYYLLPGNYSENNLQDTAISSQELNEALDSIKAQKMLIILDCCHAGGFDQVKSGYPVLPLPFTRLSDPQQIYDQLKAGHARVILLSSDQGQSSWLTLNKQHSIFTDHLLEALKGQANLVGEMEITAAILFEYVSKKVPQTVKAIYGAGVLQEPQTNIRGGRFIVALAPKRRETMSDLSNTSEALAYFNRLYTLLAETEDLDLREICQKVGISYNRLTGNSPAAKAHALTWQLKTEDRLGDLEIELRQRFPKRFPLTNT